MKKVFFYFTVFSFLLMAFGCNNNASDQAEEKSEQSQKLLPQDQKTKSSANTASAKRNKTDDQTKTKSSVPPQQKKTKSQAGNQSTSQKATQQKAKKSQAAQSQVPDGEIVLGNEIGNDLGDFESYDVDSVLRRMSDTRGKLTLMVMWNSKCGHCVKENDKFKDVYNKYHDKKFVNGDGFDVYTIGLDKLRSTWVEALEEKQYPWENNVYVLDSWKDRDIRFFGIKNLPGTFLLDENGIVLAKKFSSKELVELLDGYLKK